MKAFIEREAAVSYIKDNQCKRCSDIGLCGNCAVLTAVKLFESIPAADVRPVVRGKWERKRYGQWVSGLKCSECELLFDIATDQPSWNFCPNCGAKMDGERKGGGE